MAYGAPAPFGVCHADDLYMLFDPLFVNWIPEEGLNGADSSVSDTMIELWKNFIKTGNPSTKGTSSNEKSIPLIRVNQNRITSLRFALFLFHFRSSVGSN